MFLKYFVVLFIVQAHAGKPCTTPNNEQGECIKLCSCTVLYEALEAQHEPYVDEFVEKSLCGASKFIPMVCCGLSPNFTIPKVIISTKSGWDLLPNRQQCGLQHSDDYFRAKNDTSIRINEFPWVARIMHVPNSDGVDDIGCSGSLINKRYVLTSAECVDEELYPAIGVRLGEFHDRNETDCIQEPPYEEECSNFDDYGIEKIIKHPNYSIANYSNDIALVRLNKTVIYTDYIRPICLPSPETVRPKLGDLLFTSGWGFGSKQKHYKKKMIGQLITKEECITKIKSTGFPWIKVHDENICTALQETIPKQACNSDNGGPVMFSNHFQWYQEAIVSFSVTCGSGRPEVHTSLTNYLKWIEESLEA